MRFALCSTLLFLSCANASERGDSSTERTPDLGGVPRIAHLGGAAGGAIGTALARADVALCRSVINPIHLRGDVGESFANRVALQTILKGGGGWENVTPRIGRQGIDHILIRFDANGNPRSLMIAETKYGGAQLGITSDGRQMSPEWIKKRLHVVAQRYQRIADLKQVVGGKIPISGRKPTYNIEITLSTGQKVVFWKMKDSDAWLYDGPDDALLHAQTQAKRISTFLEAAATGKMTYRSKIFRIKLEGDILHVAVGDASKMSASGKYPITDNYELDLRKLKDASYIEMVKRELALQIRKKMPHLSQNEAMAYAKELTSEANTMQEMVEASRRALMKSMMTASPRATVFGAVFAGGMDALTQMINQGRIDISETSKSVLLGGTSAGMGSLAGQSVVLMLQNETGHAAMRTVASALRLPSAAFAANAVGATVGGNVASLIFAYGGVWLGAHTWDQAHRMSIAGGTASLVGTLAYGGTIAFATTFGTAGSGAAISSLSGAAASNAAFAWLGGGTVASGGGGMAVGALVAGGIAVAAVLVTTAGVTYVYHLYDVRQENIRNVSMIEALLSDKELLNISCERAFQAR